MMKAVGGSLRKRARLLLLSILYPSCDSWFVLPPRRSGHYTTWRHGSCLDMLSTYSAKTSGGCTDNSDISADIPPLTRFVAECELPNTFGNFRLRAYRRGSEEPMAIVLGNFSSGNDILVRVHDQSFTSEVLGSQRCDCKEQLDAAFQFIAEEGRGVIIYLQQEGRGIGLANKIAAYALQDGGLDTVEANLQLGFRDEQRSYECVPDILDNLGIQSVRLLTNNPFKVQFLENLGVDIAERLPLLVPTTESNRRYMRTKALRMAHILPPEVINGVDENSKASTSKSQSSSILTARSSRSYEVSSLADSSSTSEVFVNEIDGKEHRWEMGRESVVAAIDAIRRGDMVVVTDDASRENEGDIIMAAEMATTEAMAFAVRYTGGVICIAMPEDRMRELELPPMLANNEDPKETAFTVTVDCNIDTSTGISAKDRAQTMRMLADPSASPSQFTRPGHVFPLRAREGGVLARDGHTEASVDLCRLAGLSEAGILSEIVTDDCKDMARLPELSKFCQQHELVLTTIQDIICYRLSEGI